MPSTPRIQSFEEFWPFYLGEHRHPVNRRLHLIGTAIAILNVIFAAITLTPALLIVAPILAYAFAWTGHFLFEKNRPATWRHPLWSLRADFKMFGLFLLRKL